MALNRDACGECSRRGLLLGVGLAGLTTVVGLGEGTAAADQVSGDEIRQCEDRRSGAVRAIEGTGARLREVVVDDLTPRSGQEAAERLLAELPDAIFCANDLLAMGVLRGLLQQGVQVPERGMLMGYDDIEFLTAAAVQLTSVRQPTYQLGRIAAELLLDECDNPGDHAHQQILFQPELIVGESTTP